LTISHLQQALQEANHQRANQAGTTSSQQTRAAPAGAAAPDTAARQLPT